MKKWVSCFLALLLLMSAALAETSAQTDRLIVASFYPIYAMAENLLQGVDGVTLHCLAAPTTGCLHDQALLPADMQSLSSATALLINGAGMESYLDDVLAQFPSLPIVDASAQIELLPLETHSQEQGRSKDEHDHGDMNAHIWLDAQNACQMVRNLSDGLSAALPDAAEKVAANRDAYIGRLEALDAELKSSLAPYAGKGIVTFHAAFAYFAKAYGLNVVATAQDDPESTLSAGEMADLCKLLIAEKLPPLCVEKAYPTAAADVLASETGVKVYTLDTATTGELGEPALTEYESAMRENMNTLLRAFSEEQN